MRRYSTPELLAAEQRILEAASAAEPGFAERRALKALPDDVLAARVASARERLAERPPDPSLELRSLAAAEQQLQSLIDEHAAAVRDLRASREQLPWFGHRGEKRELDGLLLRRGADLERATERLEQLADQRHALEQVGEVVSAWDARHVGELRQGLLAGRELEAREGRALAAIEHDPPAYVVAELGSPPAAPSGRAAWREGVQVIERHRARHGVEDPERALGAAPVQLADRFSYRQAALALEESRKGIERGLLARAQEEGLAVER